MRKILLSSLIVASFAGQAFAADLPSTKSAPVLVEAPFSWSGFYIGAQVGGLWGQGKDAFPTTGVTANPRTSGVFGGGYAGYNFQVNSFVLGLQGEINGVGAGNGSVTPVAGGATYTMRQGILGSVDARLGYAFGRTLVYAIGGVALSDTKHDLIIGANDYAFNPNRDGYDVGGGIEYAFTDNWTARIEYRYYDFGTSSNYVFTCPGVARGVCNIPEHNFTKTDDTVRVGLTYKFSAPAVPPVVAKY